MIVCDEGDVVGCADPELTTMVLAGWFVGEVCWKREIRGMVIGDWVLTLDSTFHVSYLVPRTE